MSNKPVQTTYKEQDILDMLWSKKLQGMTLRQISRDYRGITYGDIQRALHGVFPKSQTKRCALGLPALLPAPACVKCGEVHVTKRCTREATSKKRPRRISVRCDDMRLAANALLRNLDATQIDELIELLKKGGET